MDEKGDESAPSLEEAGKKSIQPTSQDSPMPMAEKNEKQLQEKGDLKAVNKPGIVPENKKIVPTFGPSQPSIQKAHRDDKMEPGNSQNSITPKKSGTNQVTVNKN